MEGREGVHPNHQPYFQISSAVQFRGLSYGKVGGNDVSPAELVMMVQGVTFPLHPEEVRSDLCLCSDFHRPLLPVFLILLHTQNAIPSTKQVYS